MNEYEAKKFLSSYGISIPRGYVISSEGEIDKLSLNYPIVAKVLSEEILHKSDVGGVILNITSKREAKEAFKKIHGKFHTPVLFEEMVRGEVEVIVGVIKDHTFGHALMFGLGGIFTEIYRDVTFRVIPIAKKDAEAMIEDIRGKKILEGYRGIKVNRESVVDLLLKISKIVEDNPNIIGMDLNPVILTHDDAIVLDAKIILEKSGES